jgi:DNA polymerase-3 subunit delta
MTHDQILQSLRKGEYQPLYFLHGTESYFIDEIADYIEEHALPEEARAFNLMVLYGKDTDAQTVVDNARRFPVMAERQVIILREAQEMRTLKDLDSYVKHLVPSTVLVICHKHKKFNMNSALGKALKEKAVVFESKSLYDNQVPDWIVGYLRKKKLKITPDGAELIAEYLGTELSKIANELDKLALNLGAGTEVNVHHIEANIGISKDYNVFELQRALGERNVGKANRIVHYFAANPKKNPMPVVVGALYNYFSKVYMLHFLKKSPESELLSSLKLRSSYFLREYRMAARNFRQPKVEQVLGLLREYDLKSKGVDFNSVGKPEGALLKEMVWRILHD